MMPLMVKSTLAGGSREESPPDKKGMADIALEFLANELSSTPAVRIPGRDGGGGYRKALTSALLDVVEVCYGTPAAATGPDSWPWNSATSSMDQEDGAGLGRRAEHNMLSAGTGSRQRTWWPLTWPVRTLRDWGPRLADAAGDRKGLSQ